MRAISLMCFSVINLLFIVAIQFVTLAKLGPSNDTDALFAGMTIPSIILAVLVGSLTNVLVPQFVSAENPFKKLWEQVFIFTLGSICIVFPLIISTPLLLSNVFSGFSENTLELTKKIFLIQLLIVPLSVVSAIFTAFMNANSKFVFAEIIPAICSVLLFPIVFITIPLYGVVAVSYLYAAKIILTFLIQWLSLGLPHGIKFRDLSFKDTFNNIKYLLLGSIYYKSGPVIDRHILSNAVSGTMSIYVLVQQIFSMANLILTKSIIIPQITIVNHIVTHGNNVLRLWLLKRVTALFIFIITLFMMVFFAGLPVISFFVSLLNLNKFNVYDIWCFSVSLYGIFAGDFIATLISSTFYSKGDTKTPSILSIFSYTIFIPLKFASFFFFGPAGLAVVSSIYSLTNMVLLFCIIMVKLK